jgi:hypothetical protein
MSFKEKFKEKLADAKKDFIEARIVEKWKKDELKTHEREAGWTERVRQAKQRGREKQRSGGLFGKLMGSQQGKKRTRLKGTRKLKTPKTTSSESSGLGFGHEGSAFDLGTYGKKGDKKHKSAFDFDF